MEPVLWLFVLNKLDRKNMGGGVCPKTLDHLSNCHAERSEASEHIHFAQTDFSLCSK